MHDGDTGAWVGHAYTREPSGECHIDIEGISQEERERFENRYISIIPSGYTIAYNTPTETCWFTSVKKDKRGAIRISARCDDVGPGGRDDYRFSRKTHFKIYLDGRDSDLLYVVPRPGERP